MTNVAQWGLGISWLSGDDQDFNTENRQRRETFYVENHFRKNHGEECSDQILICTSITTLVPPHQDYLKQATRPASKSLSRAPFSHLEVTPFSRAPPPRELPYSEHLPENHPTIPEVTPPAPRHIQQPPHWSLSSIKQAGLPWFTESVTPQEHPTFWTLQQSLLQRRWLQTTTEITPNNQEHNPRSYEEIPTFKSCS